MIKNLMVYIFGLLFSLTLKAQKDSIQIPGIFERISSEVTAYRPDTTPVPQDKTTRIINELRALRGGFNISEAIAYKLEEEKQKGERPKAALDQLRQEFENGKGKQWLDNAVVHIYSDTFSYKELKKLVRFYKTSAGQKLSRDFPLLMLKSLMAAQMIQETLVPEHKK